jgi:hypothetical protein
MELYSYKYAIPHLIFWGYLFVLMFVEFRKINKRQSMRGVRALTIGGFLFFLGLRGFVNTDWYSYYPYFEQLKTLWSGGLQQLFAGSAYNFETGFELYSIIIKSICPNYFFWVFVSTAIVYIPIYFLLHRKFPKILLWSIFIVGNILFLLQIEYIRPILTSIGDLFGGRIAAGISYYLSTDMFNHPYGFSIGYFERIFTYMFVMLCYNRLLKQDHFNVVFINAYVLYFFFFFFFAEITVMTERLPFLFMFSYWILYPNLFALIKIKTNKLIIVLVAMLFFTLKVAKVNSTLFAKYDNLLFGIKGYEERKKIFEIYNSEIFRKK